MTSSTESLSPLSEKLALPEVGVWAAVSRFRKLGEEWLLSITPSSLSSITMHGYNEINYVDKTTTSIQWCLPKGN